MTALERQPATPELDRLAAIAEDSHKIGEFLDWLEGRRLMIAEWDDTDHPVPAQTPKEHLLAEYFKIDLSKVEQEKRAFLEYWRTLNDQG